MATHTQIVLVCDFCPSEEAETHTLAVDKKNVEFEACPRCWTKLETKISEPLHKGRKIPARKRRVP